MREHVWQMLNAQQNVLIDVIALSPSTGIVARKCGEGRLQGKIEEFGK